MVGCGKRPPMGILEQCHTVGPTARRECAKIGRPAVRRYLASTMIAALVTASAARPALPFDWRKRFIDPADGMFDVAPSPGGSGFVPVPIIVTEPAVGGGFGLLGQYVSAPTSQGASPDRTMVGGVITGNGSWGGGLLRQGTFASDRFIYRLGAGYADMTLPVFPFGGSREIDYSSKTLLGFANIRYRIPGSAFSIGPRFIYRTSDVSVDADSPLGERVSDLVERYTGRKQYAALGVSLNYDTRNNPMTPTEGTNAILRYDQYSSAFGSDRDFSTAQLAIHTFAKLSDSWTLGGKLVFEAASDNAPFFMDPSIDLRGVQYGRYQGNEALSMEAELRRQFTPRWAGVVFGGYGRTFVSNSRLFEATDGVWTYGAGIRYRIARKLGIDVGLDVARGPGETVFYIQLGHAWSRTMD